MRETLGGRGDKGVEGGVDTDHRRLREVRGEMKNAGVDRFYLCH